MVAASAAALIACLGDRGAAVPTCHISVPSHRYLVLLDIPNRGEFIGPHKHSEHDLLEEARQEVRKLIRAGRCRIDLQDLMECAVNFHGTEGNSGTWNIWQIPKGDRLDPRFKIPFHDWPSNADLSEELDRAFRDATESDVPLCRPADPLPRCEGRGGDVFLVYPDGFATRIFFEPGEFGSDLAARLAVRNQVCRN